jgi:hypothetical protein
MYVRACVVLYAKSYCVVTHALRSGLLLLGGKTWRFKEVGILLFDLGETACLSMTGGK